MSHQRPRLRRSLPRVVVLSLLLSLMLPAFADSDIDTEADYGARPAPLGEVVRTSGFFAHSLEAGTGIVDTVEIFNFTDTPASFDVYAADMVASGTEGQLTPSSPDVAVVGPGTWVVPETGTVQVEANESTRVEFVVDVPTGVTPGSYLAALIVEPRLPPGDANIETRARIGLRLEIEVLGEVDLGVELGQLGFTRDDDGVWFELTVSNTGTVTFAAEGEVVVSDGDGETVAELSLDPTGLFVAPDEELSLRALWEDPPMLGRYEAEAAVLAVVGTRLPVRFTSEPVTFWLVPWALIIGTIVALVVIGGALYVTRERRYRWMENRREERELLREFRKSRRGEPTTPRHSDERIPLG